MTRFALGLLLLPALGCLGPGGPIAHPEPAKPVTAPAAPPVTESEVTEGNVFEQTRRLREEIERDLKAPAHPAEPAAPEKK